MLLELERILNDDGMVNIVMADDMELADNGLLIN